MTKDTRKVPLVPGQTGLGWGEDENLDPDPATLYSCRSCLSTRIAGPIRRTVDERWAHATCLDCGERVIVNVWKRPIPQEEPDDSGTQDPR